MANTRQYTDEEIAHALAMLRANGNNVMRTARALRMPRETLNQWAGGKGTRAGKKVTDDKVEDALSLLTPKLDKLVHRIMDKALEGVERVEVTKASELRDLLVSAGINIEKGSFVRGGPTSRTEQVRVSLMDPSELSGKALRVLEGGRKPEQKQSA